MRALKWTIINGLVFASVIVGHIHGNGLLNLACWVLWISGTMHLLMVLICLGDKKMAEEMAKLGRPVPAFFSITFDLTLALYLAWHDMVPTAFAVLLSMFGEAVCQGGAAHKHHQEEAK